MTTAATPRLFGALSLCALATAILALFAPRIRKPFLDPRKGH